MFFPYLENFTYSDRKKIFPYFFNYSLANIYLYIYFFKENFDYLVFAYLFTNKHKKFIK
jgi:hypothetical protein